MAYVESDLCLQIRPNAQTAQIARNVDRSILIRNNSKNIESSKTSTYSSNPANLASSRPASKSESLSPIQPNPPQCPPIFLNERESGATNTSEYLTVNPVSVDATPDNNNTISNNQSHLHIASKEFSGKLANSVDLKNSSINNLNNNINPLGVLKPTSGCSSPSSVNRTPFAVTPSSCFSATTCSLSSVTRSVTSSSDQLTCSPTPSPPQSKAELDLSGATRKRPLVEAFEESNSENSPKRHSMEDEQGNLQIDSGTDLPPSSGTNDFPVNAFLHDPNDDNKYQLKMTIPSYAAGCIIGKGGSTIVETQKNFHAVIKLSKANECYPFTKERVVLIVGSMKALQHSGRFIQEKVREAVDLFGQKLTEENPPADQRANMAKILIPHTTVGMLIGRQGSNQKAIQAETGVRMEFSPKPDFNPITERCLTLTGSAVQINMALDKVLEKIKSDPQSGSCPNLVYNMGSAAAVLNGSLLDPSNYAAAAASAVNLENLLKLAYASAATNQYATLTSAAANPAAASFAYPAGPYLNTGAGTNAAGLYQNAALMNMNQAMLDQQTAAALYASMGLSFPGATALGSVPHSGSVATAGQPAGQQHLLPVTSPQHNLQHNSLAVATQAQRAALSAGVLHHKEGHSLTNLNNNAALLGANLTHQSHLLASAGLLPNGAAGAPGGGAAGTGAGNAGNHFLADNSSGALAVNGSVVTGSNSHPHSINSVSQNLAQEATGVYMASLPTSSAVSGLQNSPHISFSGVTQPQQFTNNNKQQTTIATDQQNLAAVKSLQNSTAVVTGSNAYPPQAATLDNSNFAFLNSLNASALQQPAITQANGAAGIGNFFKANSINLDQQIYSQNGNTSGGGGSENTASPTHAVNTQTIEVADNIVGAILGVAGKTLIEIQNLSNTRIQVSPKGDPSAELRRLTIVGPPQSVIAAVMLIEQRIRTTEELRAMQGKVTV